MEDQSQSQSPPESAEPDPSAASSTASRAASPFVEDPGQSFDPEGAPPIGAPEDAGELALEPAPEWEQSTVRTILTSQGMVLHDAIGVGDEDWAYTAAELGAIAPPLTNILNRYDATRAAAGTGDELALMIGLGGYVTRSYMERRDVLASIEDEEPEPITGVPAADADNQSDNDDEGAEWTVD